MKEKNFKENIPVSLRSIQLKNLKEENKVNGIVGFVAAYNGLSIKKQHHSPISKIIDLTSFNNND